MALKKEITCEITEHIATLTDGEGGWKKELNRVSWNGKAPELDLRAWDENHEKCGKGLVITQKEAENLLKALQQVVKADNLEL
jgi:hypothetical protein